MTNRMVQQENDLLRADLAKLRQDYERLMLHCEHLQKSEARYRQIFENAPISMLSINTGGYITQMNSAAEDLFGLLINQLNQQGSPIFDNPQLVENGTLPYMLRALAGEAIVEVPTYYDASSEGGVRFFSQGHYAPIRDEFGVVQEIVEIAPDVSALFAAQQAIQDERERAAQERAQLLSTIAQVANLLLKSPDYTPVLPDIVRLLGEAAGSDRCAITQEVIETQSNKTAVNLLTEWCQAGIPSVLVGSPEFQQGVIYEDPISFQQQLLRGETVNFVIAELQDSDWRAFFEAHHNTSMLIVPIMVQGKCWGHIGFDNCGEPRLYDEVEIAILRIAADSIAAAIERQAKEDELRKSEALYRSLFEISNEGIFRWEYEQPIVRDLSIEEQVEQVYQQFRVVQANDAYAAMYGRTHGEDMIGVKLTQIHVENSQKNQEFIRLLVEQDHQIRNIESEEVGFDEQPRYFLNSVISFTEHDRVTGGWGTQIDITELRETQQALLKAEQTRVTQLARANTTLKKTLDVLATEPDLDRSLGHVLQVTTEQLESASSALWLSNPDSNRFSLHLVYLYGDVIAATPENVDRLSGQWIRERDLSRDLALKAHIRDRVPVLYDLQHHPEVSPSQRQFMESIGVKLLLGVPLLLGSEIVGSLTVRFPERRQFSTDDLELIQALAHQATLTIQLMHLADDAKQTALLEERNRMAGEIHDTLAQAFTGISIQVGMAQKLITTSPNDTQQILDRVLALAQTGLAEARRSVWALQPDADDYADLAHNLQICVDRLTNSLPMQVELETQGTPCLVPAIVGQNLLRIAQEAINNTICHAAATQLWIRLSCEENAISLSIQDNGRGFDSQGENGGFGLLGMSERASRLNGQFTLCSQPNHGTEIRVSVPIQ